MIIDTDQQVSQTVFAKIIGVSDAAVTDLVRRDVITPGQCVGQWIVGYCAHIREQAAGRDAELASQRARLAREQADRVALQNAISRREYAPIGMLEETLAKVGRQIAAILETIPVQLKRRTEVSQKQLEIVTEEINRARNIAAVIELQQDDNDNGNDDGNGYQSLDTASDHERPRVA